MSKTQEELSLTVGLIPYIQDGNLRFGLTFTDEIKFLIFFAKCIGENIDMVLKHLKEIEEEVKNG